MNKLIANQADYRRDLKPKGKSVDEFCNQPPGSFKKFIKAQTAFEKREEIRRKERIRKAKAGMQNPPPAE